MVGSARSTAPDPRTPRGRLEPLRAGLAPRYDFYDAFLLGNEAWPHDADEALGFSRVTDMLSGHYARPETSPRSVLTLYWPLPFDTGRFTLIFPDGFQSYATSLAPQIRSMLGLLGVDEKHARRVRLTRWGHAMPLARPGFIASGAADQVRRPVEDRIWFVNQDNWALPAVENCLLDAESVTTAILKRLG